MSVNGTNKTALDRIHPSSVIDPGSYDSMKLRNASQALDQVADPLSEIAADVGWTGGAAEDSAELLVQMGRKLDEHSANLTSLKAVAEQAEQLVATNRTLTDVCVHHSAV
jgi:hypothetical protein